MLYNLLIWIIKYLYNIYVNSKIKEMSKSKKIKISEINISFNILTIRF